MGHYINATKNGVLNPLGKAKRLIEDEGAITIVRPKTFQDIPEGKTIVTVVDNGMFEAAGVLNTEREFNGWISSENHDDRPRSYLLMDKERAFTLAGIKEGDE